MTEKLENRKFSSLQKNKTLHPHSPQQTGMTLLGGQLTTLYLRSFHWDTNDSKTEALGGNSGFKKWRLTSKIESMCNKFTFVSGDNDEFQTPPFLRSANRYVVAP